MFHSPFGIPASENVEHSIEIVQRFKEMRNRPIRSFDPQRFARQCELTGESDQFRLRFLIDESRCRDVSSGSDDDPGQFAVTAIGEYRQPKPIDDDGA
jgi:hypothetical protein